MEVESKAMPKKESNEKGSGGMESKAMPKKESNEKGSRIGDRSASTFGLGPFTNDTTGNPSK